VITGVRADEALGQPFSRVWPLAQSVPADSMVPTRLECTFTRHDGTVIEVGATVAPLLSSGGQRAGQLVTFQDLTEINQKEAERQRQARLAAVGEMAAGIAHEIRNPLASMGGSITTVSCSTSCCASRSGSRTSSATSSRTPARSA
jgi:two-component system sensor histidine kinase PilS (NtrC family)